MCVSVGGSVCVCVRVCVCNLLRLDLGSLENEIVLGFILKKSQGQKHLWGHPPEMKCNLLLKYTWK